MSNTVLPIAVAIAGITMIVVVVAYMRTNLGFMLYLQHRHQIQLRQPIAGMSTLSHEDYAEAMDLSSRLQKIRNVKGRTAVQCKDVSLWK